ncbi:MAG: hypothetical protein QM500_11720 [Methylococcales bacterium]
MKTRRQMLKTGVAALTVPSIFGGTMLSKSAQAQLCRPTGIRTPGTEPDSPPVTAYTEPLFVPDKLRERPVNSFSTTPPDPNRHQRFDEF